MSVGVGGCVCVCARVSVSMGECVRGCGPVWWENGSEGKVLSVERVFLRLFL